MQLKQKISDLIDKYHEWRFRRLHRRWLMHYEKIKAKSDYLKGQDYVSTSMVADAATGRMLQVDVFSSGTAEMLAQERLQAAFIAKQAALAAMGLDENGKPLPELTAGDTK